jgi:hypothetical protein
MKGLIAAACFGLVILAALIIGWNY